jgi:hypothetical protein
MEGRGISDKFISELKTGLLCPALEAVLHDDTLCIEIRDDYINIYYRGGNMLRISEKPSGYSAAFDIKYCDHKKIGVKFKQQILGAKTVLEYVKLIPFLKAEMDLYFYEHPKMEREIQQHILRENNSTSLAKDTDYFIADIEYANMQNGSRFDMLAVKWLSTSPARKISTGLGLAFIEVKYGDNAMMGMAGLKKHFEDMESFLSTYPISSICAEARRMFNQKIELGLIHGMKETTKINIDIEKKPEFILLIANHKPASTILKRELKSIVKSDSYKRLCEKADIWIASASLMGYGLYERSMHSLEDYIYED